MRCPECNTEVKDNKRHCPNCGAPIPQQDREKNTHDEPRLGRGMMVFIIAGLIILTVFGTAYYMIHSDDPDYFRTVIEPDTNNMEKNVPKFDVIAVDTAKRDSIKKAEKLEAEKLFNSIRHKSVENTETEEESATENANETEQVNEEKETAPTTSEPSGTNTQSAPKPNIEPIETE